MVEHVAGTPHIRVVEVRLDGDTATVRLERDIDLPLAPPGLSPGTTIVAEASGQLRRTVPREAQSGWRLGSAQTSARLEVCHDRVAADVLDREGRQVGLRLVGRDLHDGVLMSISTVASARSCSSSRSVVSMS